jgi:hypothetical protein
MTDDDLRQLLRNRLQLQGIEPDDLPLFLRDLSEILKSKPEPDVAALNARLNVLGWHQVQIDYQSLQLALAWMEPEAGASSPA